MRIIPEVLKNNVYAQRAVNVVAQGAGLTLKATACLVGTVSSACFLQAVGCSLNSESCLDINVAGVAVTSWSDNLDYQNAYLLAASTVGVVVVKKLNDYGNQLTIMNFTRKAEVINEKER